MTSRSLIALIEPGSCFAGSLLELALAADRSYMLFGVFEDADPVDAGAPAAITVGPANLGPLPMGNGLTRLQTRFLGDADGLAAVEKAAGEPLEAEDAEKLGLVTFAPGRHRLGRGSAHRGRGARLVLPGRADRPGGELPVRRARRPSRPRSSGG